MKETVKPEEILLDMDGVITDFVRSVCNVHGRPNPYLGGTAHLGKFDMDKIWGMSEDTFWNPLGFDFWAGLEFMPDAHSTLSLLDDLIGLDKVCLLTAPCDTAGCCDGKRYWIRKNLPEFRKRVMIGSAKEFCSSSTRLLIEDRDSNIDLYPGPTFLVPRPWNRDHSKQANWHLQLERMFL